MASKSKKKIFFPQIRLAELVARAGGMARDTAIEDAMKSLESMRGNADAEILRSIAAMEIVLSTPGGMLDDDKKVGILRHADQIVTLAGTFCYDALDVAARSLCDVTDGLLRAGMNDSEPVAVHVRTLRLLAPGATALSGAHAETILAELAKVRAHFNFGSLAATDAGDDLGVGAR